MAIFFILLRMVLCEDLGLDARTLRYLFLDGESSFVILSAILVAFAMFGTAWYSFVASSLDIVLGTRSFILSGTPAKPRYLLSVKYVIPRCFAAFSLPILSVRIVAASIMSLLCMSFL